MVGGITCGGNDNVNDSAGVQWDRRGWGACTQVAYCRRVARPTRKEEGDNLDSCGWLHVPLIPSHHACYDVDMPMKLSDSYCVFVCSVAFRSDSGAGAPGVQHQRPLLCSSAETLCVWFAASRIADTVPLQVDPGNGVKPVARLVRV